MKTGKWGKTILALLLAVTMLLPVFAATAEDPAPADPEDELSGDTLPAAEPTDPEDELSGDALSAVSPVDPADLDPSTDMAYIRIDDQENKNLIIKGELSDGTPVEGTAASGTEIRTGDIDCNENRPAVNITPTLGAEVTLTAGDVTSAEGEGIILVVRTGKADLTVGTVETAGNGVNVTTSSSGETEIKTGDIASGGSGLIISNGSAATKAETGTIEAGGEGVHIINPTGVVDVHTGAVTAERMGVVANMMGESAATSYTPRTTVTVDGDITVEDAVYGAAVTATDEDRSAGLTVNGGISVVSNDREDSFGLYAVVKEGASVTGEVTGGISVTGEDAVSAEMANGILTKNGDGSITVNVTKDVVSSGTGIRMIDEEILAMGDPYEGEIVPGENDPYYDREFGWYYQVIDGKKVAYQKDGTGVAYNKTCLKDTREGGESHVAVTGNVAADDTAVSIAMTEQQSILEMTVDGTVDGGKHAIVLSEETVLGDNLKMTVWEVKENDQGDIAERCKVTGEEGNEKKTYTGDREAEKLIQYIIRIEDSSRSYIATAGTRDFAAGNGETYQVANQGDKVLVKLSIPDGKELVGAYWDVAQSEKGKLLKDSEGNYYLEVPRGGGVQLSLVMKDVPQPAPQPQPQPEPEPVPPRPDNYATLKFFEDRDSGPWTVVKAKGQPYRLPTPTREGQTFVGWAEGMIEPTNPNWREPAEGELCIIPGGTEYIVMGDRCFVGIWR